VLFIVVLARIVDCSSCKTGKPGPGTEYYLVWEDCVLHEDKGAFKIEANSDSRIKRQIIYRQILKFIGRFYNLYADYI
jgi:hypothetical protein